jgi:hypothetical protein
MPSSSGDIPTGCPTWGSSVLVLQLGAKGLEIGFGTLPSASQAHLDACLASDPPLELTARFSCNGETGIRHISLTGGAAGGRLRVFCLDVLAPYDFGGLVYDPLGSMASSLARLAAETPGRLVAGLPVHDPIRDRMANGLMALWAAIETDLYRFAKDPGFTAAVDAVAVTQPGEYRRFARLNELYRDLVKLLLPYGLVPGYWTAWLQGQEYHPLLPRGLALRIGSFLVGRTRKPDLGFEALSGVLLRHGARILSERD